MPKLKQNSPLRLKSSTNEFYKAQIPRINLND